MTAGVNVLAIQLHQFQGRSVDLGLIEASLAIEGSNPIGPDDSWRYVEGSREPSGGLDDEDGEWSERGRYINGKRVGKWEYASQPGF